MSDARWGDPREYDTRDPGYELPRVYDPRAQREAAIRLDAHLGTSVPPSKAATVATFTPRAGKVTKPRRP